MAAWCRPHRNVPVSRRQHTCDQCSDAPTVPARMPIRVLLLGRRRSGLTPCYRDRFGYIHSQLSTRLSINGNSRGRRDGDASQRPVLSFRRGGADQRHCQHGLHIHELDRICRRPTQSIDNYRDGARPDSDGQFCCRYDGHNCPDKSAGASVQRGWWGVQPAPQTLVLPNGPHTVAVASTETGPPGTQYVFKSWSDSGALSHSITANGAPITLIATFQAQYQLRVTGSPLAGGTVMPGSARFYDAGSVVSVSASASTGYEFFRWAGHVATPDAASTTVILNAPVALTANFKPFKRSLPTR
jgi:hypothetical protein